MSLIVLSPGLSVKEISDGQDTPRTPGIYCIVNTANGRTYVGSSIDLRRRVYHHKYYLNRGVHGSSYLQRAWTKYGENAFKFGLLEIVVKGEDLLAREQFWMDELFGPCNITRYNLAPKAGNTLGRKHTEATKERMRQIALRPRVISDETRRKLSEAGIGRMPSDETRARLSKSLKGKKKNVSPEGVLSLKENLKKCLTPEAREKAAAKLRGRPRAPAVAARLKDILTERNRSPKLRELASKRATERNKKMAEDRRRNSPQLSLKI